MEWRYFDACDVQLEESVARCGVCRGEIYRYDMWRPLTEPLSMSTA